MRAISAVKAPTKGRRSLTCGHISGLEAEASLHGVVALEGELEAVLGSVDLVAVRLAHVRRRPGDRREDAVVQGSRLLRRALERLHLSCDRVADLQRPLHALDRERDRSTFHGDNLADELREIRDRAAELSRPDVEQRLLLL